MASGLKRVLGFLLLLLPLASGSGAPGGDAAFQVYAPVVAARASGDTVADGYFLSPRFAADSAATATALATGRKTDSGNIAWAAGDPAGGALTTIAGQLRVEVGFALGIVSTVPFNHATPAAFVAHNPDRGNTAEIAHEIISDTVPAVVIGGGYDHGYFPLDNPDYLALAGGQTAYTHVITRTAGVDGAVALQAVAADVSLAGGERLFGLFGTPDGHFATHQVADAPGAPAVTRGAVEDPLLADAALAALTVLSQDPDGFFLLVEQGDIDWSNHQNNFATMIGGIWDLDRAVQAVEDFVDAPGGPEWPDTLLVLTADHANSYLRLSLELGAGDLPRQVNEGGWLYPDGEVSYGTQSHTNELVTLQARGAGSAVFAGYAGSWYPETGIVDNTQVYQAIRQAVAAGVRHVILFAGDGMQLAHEVAGSRYLYGRDRALAWHDWGEGVDGWAGFATTWDVTTYNNYAAAAGVAPYDPDSFDPLLGYDGSRGGWVPYPLAAGQ